MYDKIKNPLTGRFVKTSSRLGKSIINNYIRQLRGGSSQTMSIEKRMDTVENMVRTAAERMINTKLHVARIYDNSNLDKYGVSSSLSQEEKNELDDLRDMLEVRYNLPNTKEQKKSLQHKKELEAQSQKDYEKTMGQVPIKKKNLVALQEFKKKREKLEQERLNQKLLSTASIGNYEDAMNSIIEREERDLDLFLERIEFSEAMIQEYLIELEEKGFIIDDKNFTQIHNFLSNLRYDPNYRINKYNYLNYLIQNENLY